MPQLRHPSGLSHLLLNYNCVTNDKPQGFRTPDPFHKGR